MSVVDESLPLSESTPIAGVQMRLLDDAGRDGAPAAAPHVALDTARVLGTLLDLPEDDRDLLFSTFEAWLRAGGSATAAAASLFCHPNTVRYRLRRIETDTDGRSTIQATSLSSSPPSPPGASCRTRSDSSDRPGADQAGHACGSGRSGE